MRQLTNDHKLTLKGLVGQYGFSPILAYFVELMRERRFQREQNGDILGFQLWDRFSKNLEDTFTRKFSLQQPTTLEEMDNGQDRD